MFKRGQPPDINNNKCCGKREEFSKKDLRRVLKNIGKNEEYKKEKKNQNKKEAPGEDEKEAEG